MKNTYIYVTEMAPNGTNDLMIVDSEGECLKYLEEATFGVDVSLTNSFKLNNDTWVRDVSSRIDLIMRMAAVSPLCNRDEAESRIRAFLVEGVK